MACAVTTTGCMGVGARMEMGDSMSMETKQSPLWWLGFGAEQIQKLNALRITTLEQFAARVDDPAECTAMASYLGIDDETMATVVKSAKIVTAPDYKPPIRRGYGALPPDGW